MRNAVIFYFLTVLLLAAGEQCRSKPVQLPFLNETLEYSVSFNGLNTARSTLSCVQADSDHIRIIWTLKSKKAFHLFFHVDNRYQSLTDTRTWLTETFSKETKQKNITQAFTTHYDREKNIACTDNGLQWPVKKECTDLLSMLYHLRLTDYANTDSVTCTIDIESHVWQVTGRVEHPRNQ